MGERFEVDVDHLLLVWDTERNKRLEIEDIVALLNEQQEVIEELQVSDEMGWKRAEHFEKKCPKEFHNKKIYIKRLEYKVQKFKEMNSKQQATISQLQDLCGESDGENAKLRIENKRLQEENEQLRQQVQNAKEIAVKNDMQYQICRKEKEDFQDMCEQLRKENENYKWLIEKGYGDLTYEEILEKEESDSV